MQQNANTPKYKCNKIQKVKTGGQKIKRES